MFECLPGMARVHDCKPSPPAAWSWESGPTPLGDNMAIWHPWTATEATAESRVDTQIVFRESARR